MAFIVLLVWWFAVLVLPAGLSSPVRLVLGLAGGLTALAVISVFSPQGRTNTGGFLRFLRGRLWLDVTGSGIRTGWSGTHSWSELRDVSLAVAPMTTTLGSFRFDDWQLRYRLPESDSLTVVPLAWFGRPRQIAGTIRRLLPDAAAIEGDPG